jgi:hypothetical protein
MSQDLRLPRTWNLWNPDRTKPLEPPGTLEPLEPLYLYTDQYIVAECPIAPEASNTCSP